MFSVNKYTSAEVENMHIPQESFGIVLLTIK